MIYHWAKVCKSAISASEESCPTLGENTSVHQFNCLNFDQIHASWQHRFHRKVPVPNFGRSMFADKIGFTGKECCNVEKKYVYRQHRIHRKVSQLWTVSLSCFNFGIKSTNRYHRFHRKCSNLDGKYVYRQHGIHRNIFAALRESTFIDNMNFTLQLWGNVHL